MWRTPIVSAFPQLVVDLTGAAAGADPLAASASTGLSTAVLPIIALAASLIAAVCIGTLIVAWLRKPEPGSALAVVDPEVAGLLPVGFVSGTASSRWLPATVMQLAVNGVIAIHDRRDIRAQRDSTDPRDGEVGSADGLHLVFDGEYPLAARADVDSEGADGTVNALLSPGLSGGSRRLERGASVDVDRVVQNNGQLLAVTRDGFRDAADWYRERRPAARFRAATFGGGVGIVLGFVSLGLPDDPSKSIAWSAIVIGAVALGFRMLLPRLIPLNAAGLELRDRANRRRESVANADFSTLAAGEQLLPWAVLFDEASVIHRFAEVAAKTGTAPAWYRSTAPLSAERLASCLVIVARELAQPIRVGGGLLQRRDDSRFGVPLLFDHRGWGGGYLAGGGATAFGDGGGGGFGDGGGGGGGFDGGGGFSGGFDGGGFGGDGGGGGG
ncbi:hypothetical protein [Agromyces badenianii]|uniref:hypothetical protein n=1 Tax=Agromyces badenianii TaxID=2080742 RepID=UPI00140548E1|nr:hypothetical protein [Agromyces badenianii]